MKDLRYRLVKFQSQLFVQNYFHLQILQNFQKQH
uniref:Uncharacterized protein n=1 Tax=Iridovirus sp. TaxID=135728 RepID=A0AAU7YCL7_9VIRU